MSSGGVHEMDPQETAAGDGREHRARPWSSPAERSRAGVLLTGATGFLGMELLAQLLERTDRPVYALVRASGEREARARVQRALRLMFGVHAPYSERVVAVCGDLCRPRLGMSARRRDWLAERVEEIVHNAANVSFADGLDAARAVNVQGTRRMLELARRCDERARLRRFTYVSTAYVAGDHSGRFSEDELDVGQGFHNAYERSKFEAEQLLAGWRARLPTTVVRPSIIVGERASGWTCSFNVLYWPLRAYSRGTYLAVPARASAPVDVVPVDYVAEAVVALSQAPEAEGATFHLTAGRHASSVGELVALASEFFGRPAPLLVEPTVYRRAVHPLLLHAARDARFKRALRRSEMFFPYFAANVSYDERRTRALLHASGIEPSPLAGYFERLVEFALAADWGRRRLARAGGFVPLWTTPHVRRRPPSRDRLVPAG
jgi:thioester reductase-like protein